MKKYVDNMNQLLRLQHPEAECTCFYDYQLEEEFLCDLCLSRLKKHRSKVKRKQRIEFKHKYKKYLDE